MEPDFWLDRWNKGLTGFHQDFVNQYLKNWLSQTSIQSAKTIFVPLCGKSVDMLWLARQGYQVLGVEISKVAVEQFFTDNKLAFEQFELDNFTLYQCDNINIYQGDFFSLDSSLLENVALVYDRASLVALPQDMRQTYIDKMNELFLTMPPSLIVTLEYDQQQMSGPPFSVSNEEILDYYPRARLLESVNILEDNKKFADRGINSLIESVWYSE